MNPTARTGEMETRVPEDSRPRFGIPAGARRRLLAALLAVVGLSGCGLTHLQDLNFRVDDRLTFTSPENRAVVKQPVTVSWTIHDFTVQPFGSAAPSEDAGFFAVFVDRSPIKPGHTLKDVAKGDRFCETSPDCPDRAYLKQHFVFTTTGTSLRLPQIPNLTSKESVQLHTITVVLMDTAGHRIGESAWQLDLRIPRVGI